MVSQETYKFIVDKIYCNSKRFKSVEEVLHTASGKVKEELASMNKSDLTTIIKPF